MYAEELRAPDFFAAPQNLHKTQRSKQIGRLAAYFDGTQYDGRPDWFTGRDRDGRGEELPLRERKPCIIYPLPKAACNQATRFTFGEGRFPTVEVAATKRTEEVDGVEQEVVDAAVPELAVGVEEAAKLTAYIASCIENARIKSVMRTLCRAGTSQRTAVAVLCLRQGKFHVDMPRARDCWPEFRDGDPDGDVIRMTWCYEFNKDVEIDGALVSRAHYFRRDFTETEFVVYKDVPVVPGKPIVWERDEEQTKPHGLGFCPVYWIRNLPEPHCSEIDGVSIYDDLEDEFDALNFALSQRHRGIVYFGSPQAYESGVSEDEHPGDVGRVSRPSKTSTAPAPAKDLYRRSGGDRARKTAPDQIWSYQSPDAKPGIIETTGAAFETASKHVLDIRGRILEAMDVVLLDPMSVQGKGEMSAKALALMYAPLLALVDELRDCWWSAGLARILSGILRITATLGGKGILVPNAATVAQICQRFFFKHEDGVVWVPPTMVPSWGAYFSPSNGEIGELVVATSKAKDGGLICPKTATRAVAPYFGVTDIEAECEEADGMDTDAAERRLQSAKDALPEDDTEEPEEATRELPEPMHPPEETADAAAPEPRTRLAPMPRPATKAVRPTARRAKPAAVALPKGKLLGGRKAA